MKTCTRCKVEKPRSEFYIARLYSDGLMYTCKPCARVLAKEWGRKNPERVKEKNKQYRKTYCAKAREDIARYRKENRHKIIITERAYYAKHKERIEARKREIAFPKRYGITVLEYDDKLALQRGACAICGGVNPSGRRLAVDHNHTDGVVRGLLCINCNLLIGHAKDSPDLISSVWSYLIRHSKKAKLQEAVK